jgi:hypothetical protein
MGDQVQRPPDQLRVVSVSLGSSKRNHAVEVEMLGRRLLIERGGVDGDSGRACQMICNLGGRSFGTNVMEGVLIALAGKPPEEMQADDYLDMLRQLGWQPRVARLREQPS